MKKTLSGAQIRQEFIDFFKAKEHTFVPSSPLVPGGDATLLFTNAGMVQFKDIFLGTDNRAYNRAVNSQKCMRVAGKHNDLEDVGQDDTHHTFFEMLGNWSFGDYYKKEAISWAWELLTINWGLPEESLWATCFEDEKNEIPRDDEAAAEWRKQPGINPGQILFFGREENFWEMADVGPCGPCSEIHIDRGDKYCNKKDEPGHVCQVNGDCQRFLEIWNLVFIQYNRDEASHMEPLPACHVDTGMGLERIVSVIQDTDSNYKTDLLSPLLDKVQELTSHSQEQRESNLTPYRVIADHARAASFLIADGVVPGNLGRNYVCRMIIRRASRFGSKIGLLNPFLAEIAGVVIEHYGKFFPELERNRATILDNLTREEQRFQRTLESGVAKLESQLAQIHSRGEKQLSGDSAFELYATYGLPLEIARDIARERNLEVDESGFLKAMSRHKLASGAGDTFGKLGGEDADLYREIRQKLLNSGKLPESGVIYNPFDRLQVKGEILSLISGGANITSADPGDQIEIILPETCFYVESGGQVSDTGFIQHESGSDWTIKVNGMRKPAAGIIVHVGEVVEGSPGVGEKAIALVDAERRLDVMRNHTATHLLHSRLRNVLGDHARQAGSLVAPDRLRFDFTHPEAVTQSQLEEIEIEVNQMILSNYPLLIAHKPLDQAVEEGATALFGEKYDEVVRNITIGEPVILSNELCGGTHVEDTGEIGLFVITSEGSVAAGIRRIEAITGRAGYEFFQKQKKTLQETAELLSTSSFEVPEKSREIIHTLELTRKQRDESRQAVALIRFLTHLERIPDVKGVPVLTAILEDSDAETLRQLLDTFRERNPTGIAALGTITENEKPILVVAVSDDLVERGISAGDLVKDISKPIGGGGGGKPTMAQAGGKDASRLKESLDMVAGWVEQHLVD